MKNFYSSCEKVKKLTFEISHLIDDFDMAQVDSLLAERQRLMEVLAAYVESHQSDEYRTSFVELLSLVAEQDAIDKQKCEQLRDKYKDKLASQFKTNKAIKQYKSFK